MSDHELTDAQRADWRRFVEFHNAEGTGRELFPNDAEIVTAIDARLAWLEADHALIPAVVAMQEETSEVLRTIRVEVEGLRAERDHLHVRADRATAELLALGREVRQAREERDQALTLAEENHALKVEYNKRYNEAVERFTVASKERDQAYAELANVKRQIDQYLFDGDRAAKQLAAERDRAVAEAAMLRGFIASSPVLEGVAARVVRQPLDAAAPLAARAAAVLLADLELLAQTENGAPFAMPYAAWDAASARWFTEVLAYRAALAGKESTI